ncbi:hypothetical protein CAEBREN_21473 [Caenorhabditis brenneri]|uniref:Protein kinase domain-containing protein n=1 Tax=Caenorhabditis brenneri TaxID=135651 RepID=G0P1H0_CAEBE|nr:hypothetical protein CAEBREN_21473 [Caenorhabditis brenneri]
MPIDIPPGTIVFQEFLIQRQIGVGSSATVFCVRDEANNDYADYKALKLTEINETNRKSFIAEVTALHKLKNLSVIPNIFSFFETKDFFGIVETLQGDSLYSLRTNCGKDSISAKAALCIAYHLFDGIHIFQSQGILHRDVTMRNLCFKTNHKGYMNPIVILDFGSSERIIENPDPLHSESMFKDSRYVTPNMSDQNPTVRKDDAFMAVYLLLELFDWNVFGTHTRATKDSVMRKKLQFETEPEKFTKIPWIIKIVKCLNSNLYEEKPNYAEVKSIIRKAMKDFDPRFYKIDLGRTALGKQYIM